MFKRIFDVTISTFVALLSAPLVLAIGLLIKLESPGPIIISTQRVGKNGRHFAHHRFRTMTGLPLQKTQFGRFIGNLSLDDVEHQSWWFDLQLILKSLYHWLRSGHLKGRF